MRGRRGVVPVVAVLAAAALTVAGCTPANGGPAVVGRWQLHDVSGQVPRSAAAVMAGDHELLLLGGTGGTPQDHHVGPGLAVDLVTGEQRTLAAPDVDGALGRAVVGQAAGVAVVVGTPCLSDEAYSTGDCAPTPLVAATYSVADDRWSTVAAPPVGADDVLDPAGSLGPVAVFVVRGTGEAIGWDTAVRHWSRLAGPLAPSGVVTCAAAAGPVAVTSSSLVDGATTSVAPTPTVTDGGTVSGVEPPATQPVVHVLGPSGWTTRGTASTTSLYAFEVACGGNSVYLLARSRPGSDSADSGGVGYGVTRVDLTNGTASVVPPDPRVAYGSWLHGSVAGNRLLLLGDDGIEEGGVGYDPATGGWTATPRVPSELIAGGFRVIAASDTNVVVRGLNGDTPPIAALRL